MQSTRSGLLPMLSANLKKWDIFPMQVPSMNLKGQDSIKTITGGLVSMLVISIVMLFAFLKLSHLLERKNPTINTLVDSDEGADAEFDTSSNGFQFAFALADINKEPLEDAKYLKWFARVRKRNNGKDSFRLVATYKCTERDYMKFYPPQKASRNMVDSYRSSDSFYCIDWDSADLVLYGDKS